MSSSLTCTKLTILTITGVTIQIIGLSLFVYGFFPVKPALSGVRYNYNPSTLSAIKTISQFLFLTSLTIQRRREFPSSDVYSGSQSDRLRSASALPQIALWGLFLLICALCNLYQFLFLFYFLLMLLYLKIGGVC